MGHDRVEIGLGIEKILNICCEKEDKVEIPKNELQN